MLPSTTSIRIDWADRCTVAVHDLPWVSSPASGVERKLLERDGGELARATSVVRYAPGSSFDTHVHGLGEEILVLEGIFSDEFGDYGPGTYLRNPPGSSHAPFSRTGCTLFVKLRYFDLRDDQRVVIDTQTAAWRRGLVPGLQVPLPPVGGPRRPTALVGCTGAQGYQRRQSVEWQEERLLHPSGARTT